MEKLSLWLLQVAAGQTFESHAHTAPQRTSKERRLQCCHQIHHLPFTILWPPLDWEPACGREGCCSQSITSPLYGSGKNKETPKPWDSILRHNRSSPERSTHLGQATVLHDCRQELQSLFEGVSNRWASDAFPQQRLGWVDQGNEGSTAHYHQKSCHLSLIRPNRCVHCVNEE